jgi:hypothetical protein
MVSGGYEQVGWKRDEATGPKVGCSWMWMSRMSLR